MRGNTKSNSDKIKERVNQSMELNRKKTPLNSSLRDENEMSPRSKLKLERAAPNSVNSSNA
jgi:hypothetical protein